MQQPRWIQDFINEREKQDARWGIQHHPDDTGDILDAKHADILRRACNLMEENGGTATWRVILLEEVYEALAESDVDALRKELVQVGAVVGAWIEDIDSRKKSADA